MNLGMEQQNTDWAGEIRVWFRQEHWGKELPGSDLHFAFVTQNRKAGAGKMRSGRMPVVVLAFSRAN